MTEARDMEAYCLIGLELTCYKTLVARRAMMHLSNMATTKGSDMWTPTDC